MFNTGTAIESPDAIVTCDDEATVLGAIKDISAHNRLFVQSGHKTVGYTDSATHWILAMVLTPVHATRPLHRVVFFPKSKYTERDVNNHLAEYTREILPFDEV